MHLLGIGFSTKVWHHLLGHLRQDLGDLSLGSILLEGRASLQRELELVLRLSEGTPPEMVLLNASGLKQTPDLLKQCLQMVTQASSSGARIVLAVDEVEEDMGQLLGEGSVLQLTNGMQVRPMDSDVILAHSIRSFPRIRLNNRLTLRYEDPSGQILEQTLEELAEGTLLPWRRVTQVKTDFGWEEPRIWMTQILTEVESTILPEQVQGILREQSGGFLFPGVPYPSILGLQTPEFRVDHCLRAGALNPRSTAFRKMMASFQQRVSAFQEPPPISRSIRCLGQPPVLNEVMRQVLQQQGYTNVSALSQLAAGRYTLEADLTCLQLSQFPEVTLKGDLRDCVKPVQQVTQELASWVELEDLSVQASLPRKPMRPETFRERRNRIVQSVRANQDALQLAQNRIILYEQEQEALRDSIEIARVLLELEAEALEWNDALNEAPKIRSGYVLLLCDDEQNAMDLYSGLNQVTRKLWIDTSEFSEPEHLRRLDVRSLKDESLTPLLIVTEEARIHLVELCGRTLESVHGVSDLLNQQFQVIARAEAEHHLINFERQELALHHLTDTFREIVRKEFPALEDVSA
jgi:hypothetical protein